MIRQNVLTVFLLVTAAAVPPTRASADDAVLARVEVAGPVAAYPLPVHAHLRDGAGRPYLLVFATRAALDEAGWPCRVLDSGARPEDYVLATPRRRGAREAAAGLLPLVHDDGARWVLRDPEGKTEALAGLGFALKRLPRAPVRRTAPAHATFGPQPTGAPDPLVGEIVARVDTNRLHALMRRLTGVEAAVAGGDLYVIETRHTLSGTPIERATQFAYEHFQGLGLDVRYQNWSDGSTSGRNVIGTQPGGVLSNEIVVVVAHLDNMPSGTTAPGADDNASGSAAVITAAEMFRQYRFDRTVRFLLVTGEEQWLYGSEAHAAAAEAAGENIVAVFNMDMIAWDTNGDGALGIHTRPAGDSGYAADLALAVVFTNVVAQHGLGGVLWPAIVDDGELGSDHASFWDHHFAAVLAIEDYNDFNDDNYHKTSDTLASLNWTYYTRCVRASLGTVAQLAGPAGRVPCDVIEVATLASAPGGGTGASAFYARHEPGAAEGGPDGRDIAWSNQPANPNSRWLKIHTAPYAAALAADARPTNSETLFSASLSLSNAAGTVFACTNRLRFDLLTVPDSNRTYLARVRVDGRFMGTSNGYDTVLDLRSLVTTGNYLTLPPLTGLSNGVVYGTCELGARFVRRESSNCALRIVSAGGTQAVIEAAAQLGTRVLDKVEGSTNLLRTNGWTTVAVFTNDVPRDPAQFESGWTHLPRPVPTNGAPRFYRLKREWLAP